MDDEDEILYYTDISGDGKLITFQNTGNPFITSSQQAPNESRKEFNNRITRERNEKFHQSLVAKTEQTQSSVPPFVSAATSQYQSRAATRSTSIRSVPASKVPRERTRTMPECMHQMRQIYMTQLFIDKKKAEMAKLSRSKVITEDKIEKEEKRVNSEISEYKQSMNALQAALSKSRKKAAENSQMYSTLIKELSQLQSNVNAKSAIISKNEEILEQYQELEAFLRVFLPRDYEKKLFDYYKTPQVLLQELDEMQRETLNLVNCYQHIVDVEGVLDEKTEKRRKEQEEEDEQITKMIERTELPTVETYQTKTVEKNKDILSAKIDKLKHTISDTYVACFGRKADISPMNMLEKIEQELEHMLKIEQTVAPDVLEAIKAQREEERRQRDRLEGQEKRRLEQLGKIQKALERANKQIPRHDKKKPIERMIPVKKPHRNDMERNKEKLAQEQEERMLYAVDD